MQFATSLYFQLADVSVALTPVDLFKTKKGKPDVTKFIDRRPDDTAELVVLGLQTHKIRQDSID